MDERMKRAAEDGDVDALYSILAADPYVLDRIDHIPFVDTPLHIAARAGNTHFAVEIASLKPSLVWKLNHLGLSPIHLAMQNEYDQLVRAIMIIDSEVVHVKAKGRVTPLHYAAQIENVDLLAEFLSVCPSSIEDLTVQCETAVHVAVKNNRFRAFKVLLGWLRRVDKEEILKWKDEDGNTALHIATCTSQPEVMKLLIKSVNINAKNFSGLTAMDIFHLQGDSQDREVGNILRRAKAKRASELSDTAVTLADYLSLDLSLIEKRDKYLGTPSQSPKRNPSDLRNVVLVVAILIATATYQAGLSPPGGYWQDDYNPPTNKSTSNITITNSTTDQGQGSSRAHRVGEMAMDPSSLFQFFTLNTIAFYSSMGTILIVIVGLPYSEILSVSISFLFFAYYTSLATNFPTEGNVAYKTAMSVFIPFTYIAAMIANLIPSMVSSRHEKLKRRVD